MFMHGYSTNRGFIGGGGGAWEAVTEPSMQTEGLESGQETTDEEMSLSALCCVGHSVPSQFLEASVQEEGSALHKLVGNLVDSHRLLSLFIIVSPVL